jgi:UDP-N-acetylmuramate dehydrogenase
VADLEVVHRAVRTSQCRTLVIGKGSNLLVSDRGFHGVAVTLAGDFEEIAIDADRALVTAGATALLPVVARKTASAGLTGFEWAVGVPGSIGGAVRMNAGGHGSDMAASVVKASIFDLRSGGPDEWDLQRLNFAYRQSDVQAHQLVLFAQLQLAAGDVEVSNREISEIVRWRRENQPGGQNAGSVFTNPPGDSAGRIIDDLGLKGFRIGSAEVSAKHANFIQADPGGSADDVFALIRELRLQVAAAVGVELEVENRLIGFDREPNCVEGPR